MKTQVITKMESRQAQSHLAFSLFVCATVLLCWKTITALASYALHNQAGSQILLVPLIIGYLLFDSRRRVFSMVKPSLRVGITVLAAGGFIYLLASRDAGCVPGTDSFSVAILGFGIILVGGFFCSYGLAAARAAAFPLGLLVLMIPLPETILNWTIEKLQQGSTDISCWLFNIVGVPVLRNGFVLSLPTLTIEVASECSGIRSSIALFITCLLAAYFYLRNPWKRVIFLSLVIPLAVLKNGIRIVTLTLLSIYVDRGFLDGRLHRDGGFVFFALALLMLYPILRLLEKSESRTAGLKARTVSLGEGINEQGAAGTAFSRNE